MIPFIFPKRQALAGSILVFVYEAKVYARQLQIAFDFVFTHTGILYEPCTHHGDEKGDSISDVVAFAPFFLIDFAGQSFLKHPLYWDHQLRTLKLSVMELFFELVSIQLGTDCSTLMKNDTVLDCRSGPWLTLSSRTPNGSAMKFSFSSVLCFLYFFPHTVPLCFHGSVEFNESSKPKG